VDANSRFPLVGTGLYQRGGSSRLYLQLTTTRLASVRGVRATASGVLFVPTTDTPCSDGRLTGLPHAGNCARVGLLAGAVPPVSASPDCLRRVTSGRFVLAAVIGGLGSASPSSALSAVVVHAVPGHPDRSGNGDETATSARSAARSGPPWSHHSRQTLQRAWPANRDRLHLDSPARRWGLSGASWPAWTIPQNQHVASARPPPARHQM